MPPSSRLACALTRPYTQARAHVLTLPHTHTHAAHVLTYPPTLTIPQALARRKGGIGTPDELSALELLGVGGVCGIFGWLSTYPIDVVKTRIQVWAISVWIRFSCVSFL